MPSIQEQAEILIKKIKHILISTFGKLEQEANIEEYYLALCLSLREELMLQWAAKFHSIDASKDPIVYFLSMEYLPGKILGNSINNLGDWELLKLVVKKSERNLQELLECEPDPGLGNGGLGRLISCYLESLATLEYPSWGYGLRYQYGIFEQEIWNGIQVEKPDCWLLKNNPLETRKDLHSVSIFYKGNPLATKNSYGEEVFLLEDYEEVRAIPFDTPIVGYAIKEKFPITTMRLWTTKESPKNFELQRFNAGQLDQAGENSSLTDVLYPNDNHEVGKRIRLKQEFLLVSASLQDIIRRHMRVHGEIRLLSDKVRIQINDTHPAMVIAELIRKLNTEYDLPWKEALKITEEVCNYTNHTVLKESLEEWNEKRVEEFLPRQYRVIQKLNLEFCNSIREKFPGDEERVRRMSIIHEGQIRMAHLAILGSKKVNGVAELHSKLLKEKMFKDFYDLFPDKFINITNGVSQRRFLYYANPLLAEFITKRIGNKWIYDFQEIAKLAPYQDDETAQKEFLEIKRKCKEKFFYKLSTENPLRDQKGKIIDHTRTLSCDALVDVQIKRIHEYKRQLMLALHLYMLYEELKANPKARKVKRMVIMAGKAAPGYVKAKQILLLFNAIARKINEDPIVSQTLKAIFVENYNVSKAETIIPASDLSEQISTAGMEASGTGNFKLAMNGALTIATEDGANIEIRKKVGDAFWPFSFGLKNEEIATFGAHYNPYNIYNANHAIKTAVDALHSGALARSEVEEEAFKNLFDSLIVGRWGERADKYYVLKDLLSYYETQKKVEELFLKPLSWARIAIHNIASTGYFSSDRSIEEYVEKIWHIAPCPIDQKILKKIKSDFAEKEPF